MFTKLVLASVQFPVFAPSGLKSSVLWFTASWIDQYVRVDPIRVTCDLWILLFELYLKAITLIGAEWQNDFPSVTEISDAVFFVWISLFMSWCLFIAHMLAQTIVLVLRAIQDDYTHHIQSLELTKSFRVMTNRQIFNSSAVQALG